MSNPYRLGTPLWCAYQQGKDEADEKWRNALVGKLPARKPEKAGGLA